MAKFFWELLFGIVRSLAGDLMNSVIKKVDAWLGTKFKGRAAIVVGLLLGLAAYGFFPIIGLLLAH
jgi:hypothetical protein